MPFSTHSPIPINEKLSVKELINKLRKRVNINLIACAAEGHCSNKYVSEAELNRPGLAHWLFEGLFFTKGPNYW